MHFTSIWLPLVEYTMHYLTEMIYALEGENMWFLKNSKKKSKWKGGSKARDENLLKEDIHVHGCKFDICSSFCAIESHI